MRNQTKRATNASKEQRAAYLFLIPALLGLSFITYLPLLAVFGISLTDLNVGHFIKGGTLPPVKFVGFDNFAEIFRNPSIDFLNSIKVTVTFALIAVVSSIIYSMLIAMLLNRKMPARGFFRAVFYIPYILPATAVMISWWFLLKYDGGLINYILVSLGHVAVEADSPEKAEAAAMSKLFTGAIHWEFTRMEFPGVKGKKA